jgi:hypothetical protein
MSIFRASPGRVEPNEITDSNLSKSNINATLGPYNLTTGNRNL